MIVTEKDLNSIILIGFPNPENSKTLLNFEIDGTSYHLVTKIGNSWVTWDYPTDDIVEAFNQVFSFKEVKINNIPQPIDRSLYFSELYDVLFEVSEEDFLYFKLKYCS